MCLYGASGHGKVVKQIANNLGMDVAFFFDDNPDVKLLQDTVVKHTDELNEFTEHNFLISIGNNRVRKKVTKKLPNNFIKLIDVSSSVADNAVVNNGTVIMPKVVINSDVKIGEHVIINSAAVVDHDCVIDSFVHISPNATITGNVKIGEGTHIGAGATVIPNITIGKWVTIGAGTVIIKDIPDYAVVVGNPGKIVKYNKYER
ncbi:acetyltransferase [Polaribacter batillariae]|uniref:Acetyltransferase n=1 Tax=Polaribacter batillariae TaxID=2808900 RepID=A0ABX7T1L4_9FLAO|nr:acetyltransferase [Polaribacter batillariae]